MSSMKIILNEWLSPGTICVSSDIYKFLKEQYTDESRDQAFLKMMGISRHELTVHIHDFKEKENSLSEWCSCGASRWKGERE